MKKIDIAYMAGIFDGEGCISIGKHQRRKNWNPTYSLKISVVMCNPYIPKLFQMAFGGRIDCYERVGYKLPHWNWHLDSKNTIPFLEAIMPYLRLKRDEARLALEFQKLKKVKHTFRGNSYKPEEIAVFEAEKILMSKLHDKTEVFNER